MFNPPLKVATTSHYRPIAYAPQPAIPRPNITDDYERWYTEAAPNNRMLLSLRSGIHSEIGWALDRLCRLCDNEQFLLKAIPGLTDVLFEWPEWYASRKDSEIENLAPLFAPDITAERERRHALESLFILRNSALHEPNALELANHPRTQPMIIMALHNRRADLDINAEFILHAIELLHAVASKISLSTINSPLSDPITQLQHISAQSSNRALIIASLTALTSIMSTPANAINLTPTSPALAASIRYLPLFTDKPLIDACLNYLYIHLSQPPLARAFLLRPDMPAVLKILVSLLLNEQVEETVSLDIGGDVHSVPALFGGAWVHDLSQEELDTIIEKPEPERCYEWMKAMFVAKPGSELTQVVFWNLYRHTFTPFQDRCPLLAASEVIKNVTVVFPQSQAMVLPGPPQRFVVRGIDRRQHTSADDRFKCQWDRKKCSAETFQSPGELYIHLQDHINESEQFELSCSWKSCDKRPLAKPLLRAHVLVHVPSSQPQAMPPSQSDTITLPREHYPFPTSTPTQRPPPPPGRTLVTFPRPTIDPPSSSLTALLCIRILFRTSFASLDAAPRVDADHFGFPGIIEDLDGQDFEADIQGAPTSLEEEGERRGRRAFVQVRSLMESVRIKDEVLMSWMDEMVDAGYSTRS